MSDEDRSPGLFAAVPLLSLAPDYDEEQHETYVARLEESIKDDRNRNIALTGRYGSGKSSVIDEFVRRHEEASLRIGIHTLAPDDAGTTLTNRLQKEIVKQLNYSAQPATVRHSRFARIRTLTLGRAVAEAALTVAVAFGLLYLLGLFPSISGTEAGRSGIVQALSWGGLFMLTTAVVTIIRLVTFDRYVVLGVGPGLTLTRETSTYFDDFLDEIVHYFNSEDKRFVIFEDLDRFDEPKIFESLRELNTIVNNTPKRRFSAEPIRFIYAVKDSLFERLGVTDEVEADAASTETERSNRTKFFDLVIPLVPFISHRNARELMTELLEDAGIDDVDRRLIEHVARHTTDMRLMVNMRNEYLVFAERLLDSGTVAPDLSPSNLFALMAYKAFHLKDFEEISRRSSALDQLYRLHREVVRDGIAHRQARQREIAAGRGRSHSRAEVANVVGRRLSSMSSMAAATSHPPGATVSYDVAGSSYTTSDVLGIDFWAEVARAGELTVALTPARRGYPYRMARADLEAAFPEAVEADRWDEVDETETKAELAGIIEDIARLRGADFADLAAMSPEFSQAVDDTLNSELAADLVKSGYLTKHFGTYAAQFYGHFTGVDVATFIMQTVETHGMDIDYQFTTPGAVANLLEEVGEEFTRTISAYNRDVVDHLLEVDDDRVDDVAGQVVERFDQRAHAFLSAYLTSGAHPQGLVARLAKLSWPPLLRFLVTDNGVPEDARVGLVDSALAAGRSFDGVDVDGDVSEFLARHHPEMTAFTAQSAGTSPGVVADILQRGGLRLDSLAVLHPTLRREVVRRDLYTIDAENIRLAVGEGNSIDLDQILEHEGVYRHCLANPDSYLAALEADAETPHTIQGAETLLAVLGDAVDQWSAKQFARLLDGAAEASRLSDIGDAPTAAWSELARAALFEPSLRNVHAYVEHTGSVDPPLGSLLQSVGAISAHGRPDTSESDEGSDPSEAVAVAVALLEADDVIEGLDDRIALVRSLGLRSHLPVAKLAPQDGEFLASLLRAGLVDDTEASFHHLPATSWSAMEAAISASTGVGDFIVPDILNGWVADLFESDIAAAKLGRIVLRRLDEFVADEDRTALARAAAFALTHSIPLPLTEVRRVAASNGPRASRMTVRLLAIAEPTPSVDDVVTTLAALGDPYDRLMTGGRVFEVPYDDDFRNIFEQLKVARRCQIRKKRGTSKLKVWPPGGET